MNGSSFAGPDGSNDARLVELWLSLKVSSHTRRAYASDVERFVRFAEKPLGWVTLGDVQTFAASLEQKSLKLASQNRALTAVKSLLAFGQQTGYLPSTSERPSSSGRTGTRSPSASSRKARSPS